MNGAQIQFTRRGAVQIAALPSDVEISQVAALRLALFEAVDNRDVGLVIDLTRTEYVDSSGVNMLFDLAESLAARQIKLVVVLPPGGLVERVIEIVNLESVTPIERDLDAAVAAIEGAAG